MMSSCVQKCVASWLHRQIDMNSKHAVSRINDKTLGGFGDPITKIEKNEKMK
jgi:hypothetical protein